MVSCLLEPGHPEIQNLGLPVIVHKNIGGLEVPVDDALTVGIVDAVRQLVKQGHAFPDGQVMGAGIFDQRSSLDELHGEIGGFPIAGLDRSRRIQARNARVFKPAEDFHLLIEAPALFGDENGCVCRCGRNKMPPSKPVWKPRRTVCQMS